VINWMPEGHPSPMVYTVPHFDFHFYMIPNAERLNIVLGGCRDGAQAPHPICRPRLSTDLVHGRLRRRGRGIPDRTFRTGLSLGPAVHP
jgi:hypothetical protein